MKVPLIALILASGVFSSTIYSRQSPVKITGDTSAYSNAAKYTQASYCTESAGKVINGATVSKVFGNGDNVPYAYVAYNPTSNQIIVAHEGTDVFEIQSILVDAQLWLVGMNSRLSNCGFASGSRVHSGFQNAWASTADAILAEVNRQRAAHSGASVLVTGHSLGAAIATLDIAYLKCKIPNVNLRGLIFAAPRVGNAAFAGSIPSHTNVVNGRDIVPGLPPPELGYAHSAGEVWINPANSNNYFSCPGSENPSCSRGVGTFDKSALDHVGTYFGVPMPAYFGC